MKERLIDVIAGYISNKPLYLFILIVIIVRMLDILTAYLWFTVKPESFFKYEAHELAKEIFRNTDWNTLLDSIIIPFFIGIFLIAVIGYYSKIDLIKFLLLAYAIFGIVAILSNIIAISPLPRYSLYILAPLSAWGWVIVTVGIYAELVKLYHTSL